MKTELPPPGHITENGIGIGSVTPEMVQQRASELAVINGREAHQVWPSDVELAQQELTGALDAESDIISTDGDTNAWNPVPGSPGHRAPDASSDDEEDWQTDSDRLVQEGVGEAEHDQMVQAMQLEHQENAD